MTALTAFYPWIKALHILSVVAWMAGLLYLPRLFVYHAERSRAREASETFKVMERRLLRGIMHARDAGDLGLRDPAGAHRRAWSIGARGWFYAKLALRRWR